MEIIIRLGIGLSMAMSVLSLVALAFESGHRPESQNGSAFLSRDARRLKRHYLTRHIVRRKQLRSRE